MSVRPPAEFHPPKWVAAAGPGAQVALVAADRKLDVGLKPSYVIGRNDTADIVLSHASISRHHAAVAHHSDGRVYIIDLKSACGTKVDGKRIDGHRPTELRPGASVCFGEDAAQYVLSGASGKRPAEGGGHDHGRPMGGHPSGPAPPLGGGGAKRARTDAPAGPSTVQCRHLLIKHRDSRFRPPATEPTSSNPLKNKEPVTRTKESAREILAAHLAALTAQHSAAATTTGLDAAFDSAFETLATAESDCSSAKRGGDLGPFRRGQMHPDFEKASFELGVGELCKDAIETPSGFHTILRIG